MRTPAGAAGYTHPAYLASLAHIGTPVRLPSSGGWVLQRSIPGTEWHDCIGPYPLFLCGDWPALRDDLAALAGEGAVSVTIVPDPFGTYSTNLLASTFDVVREVKRRSIVNLQENFEVAMSPQHRRRAARALERIRVDRCTEPHEYADAWVECYRAFAATRGIGGPAAFPARSLIDQLSVPGMRMYRAASDEAALGFSLWMIDGAHAYGHLAAYTEYGREAGVAYAFYASVLADLQESGISQVDLGAGLDAGDGLERWKEGWTRLSLPSMICGAMLRPSEYASLSLARGAGDTSYFPAYRGIMAPRSHMEAT
jgi:hypothetical protein